MLLRRTWLFTALLGAGAFIGDTAVSRPLGTLLNAQQTASPMRGSGNEQEPDPSAAAAAESALRDATASFLAALDSGDAKKVAGHWTPRGEYAGPEGQTIRGRQDIEAKYAANLDKLRKIRSSFEVDSVRFLAPGTAIQEGYFRVRPGNGETPVVSRYSALYVRDGDTWRIALLREWPSDGYSLRELDWLIGTWVTTRDGTEVRTTYAWALNKSFLQSRLRITRDDEVISGTQMIGKDAATGFIRMWTFESQGGFGEATWTKDGNKWVVETNATLPDGSVMTATNIYTRLGDNAFQWQSINRTLDGEPLEDVAPIKVIRATTNQ